VTGITPYVEGLPAKQMELAREVVPRAARIGVLANVSDPKAPPQLQELEAAGRDLGVTVVVADAPTPDDVDGAGHGAHRRWDVFRPGDCDWFCEPSRYSRSRRSEWHLSRLLLRRRPGWHRDPWSDLRSHRLVRLCRRNRAIARCGRTPRWLPEKTSD
jgi:hypothetical protein